MGSPATEAGRYDIETQHSVTLTHGFAIPEAEVTQTQFFDLLGYDPAAHTGCPDCPVEMVNWHEATAYCNALSTAAGRATCFTCSGSGASVTCTPRASYATPYDCPGYRLPTEAEWEYAARAGTTAATYGGDLDLGHIVCEEPNPTLDPIAWFCGNAGGTTHPIRSLDPNPWGLYDMIGNVWEWTSDWFVDDLGSVSVSDPTGGATGTYRTVRGGCWNHVAAFARSAERGVTEPTLPTDRVGFRTVRTLP